MQRRQRHLKIDRSAQPRRSHLGVLIGCVVAALLCSQLVGCQPNYDPPSLINKLRVLGVRASPPQVRIGGTTSFDALVVGHDVDQPLCFAWAFCPLAFPRDGEFKCIDDEVVVPLGNGSTAELTSQQVQEATSPEKLQKVLDKHGFKLPAQLDTTEQPDIQAVAKQLAAFQLYVMFKIATADEFGGTCPTGIGQLTSVCKDRDRCLQGNKRVSLALLPQYFHENPRFTGLRLDEVEWPAALTPTVPPYDPPPDAWDAVIESGLDADLFPGFGPTARKIVPEVTDESRETIPEKLDDAGKPKTEELLYSWFSSSGSYQKNRTWHEFPDNQLLPPEPADVVSPRTVSVWVVVRDGRNGTDWVQRRVTVDRDAPKIQQPLCSLDAALDGCTDGVPKG